MARWQFLTQPLLRALVALGHWPAGCLVIAAVFQDMSCEWLAAIMKAHSPERAAFEEGFVSKKPKGYFTPVGAEDSQTTTTTTTIKHPDGTTIVTTSTM
jgi:hypothetical protein|eukprot:COSAG01_NODE_20380_length_957_cov_1.370629_1_plen_99_part_00